MVQFCGFDKCVKSVFFKKLYVCVSFLFGVIVSICSSLSLSILVAASQLRLCSPVVGCLENKFIRTE